MRILLILACLPLLALDNAKTIHNLTASALTNYPFTLHYFLAQGEVTNFPRPYAIPSDTGTRSAVSHWQADVKSRWRDGFSSRAITGVLSGDPTWATGGNGLVSIVEATNDISTITFSAPHNLKFGDRLMVSGATGDTDLNRDHYIVIEDTTLTPNSVKIRTQNVSTATYSQAGLTVTHVIDPWASGQCRIKSPFHGLEKADAVTITDVVGMLDVNGEALVSDVSRDEFIINKSCSGVYTSGGVVTGPDFGSVKSVLVSFISTVPASGELKVDVVNATNRCYLPTLEDCNGAGTSSTAMVQDIPWGIQLEATAVVVAGSTATKSANAKTILSAWNGVESYCGTRYWLRGPVVTQWLIENGNVSADGTCPSTYDFGWQNVMSSEAVNGNTLQTALTIGTGTSTDTTFYTTLPPSPDITPGTQLYFAGYSTTNASGTQVEVMTVVSVTGNTIEVTRGTAGVAIAHAIGKPFGVLKYKDSVSAYANSLHPAFAVTYYPEWTSGVKVEARMENVQWRKQISLWYAPTIKTGTALDVRWSRDKTLHNTKSRWRKQFWDGADPEFICSGGAGTDPDNCSTTGGGSRSMRYYVDHNGPYLKYAGYLPTTILYNNAALDFWYAEGENGIIGDSRYRGFNGSDRGDYGVVKNNDATKVPPATTLLPFLYAGEGTGVQEFRGTHWAVRDWQNGTGAMEGWWPTKYDAFWTQMGFVPRGYNILLGSTVAGGGGNAAVEGHWPLYSRDDVDRPFVFGWPVPGRGRTVSVQTMPTMATVGGNGVTVTGVLAEDKPWTSCGWALGGANTSSFTAAAFWPCFAYPTGVLAAASGAGVDPGHLVDYQSIAWLVTGDEWFWQGLVLKAGWSAGVGHTLGVAPGAGLTGRLIGKPWAGSLQGGGNHIRFETWPEFSIVQALIATPTELLYGQTSNPERALLNAYIWDYALQHEGVHNNVNGWSKILFPLKWTSSCVGYSTALNDPTSSDHWRLGRCGMGRPNALGYFHSAVNESGDIASHATEEDLTIVNGNGSPWMMSYQALAMTHLQDCGFPQYRYARQSLGKFVTNITLNRKYNPFLTGYYRWPTRLSATNNMAQTWDEWKSMWTPVGVGIGAQATNSFPLAASSPLHYQFKSYAAVPLLMDVLDDATTPGCTPTDRPPVGCTGDQALAFFRTNMNNQQDAVIDPRWAGAERRPRITSVRATLSGGTATIRWVAPDGAACKVALNPTSSYDTGDATATAVGRMQSWSGSATAGQARITCGQARTYVTLQ